MAASKNLSQWWKADDDELHEGVMAVVRRIEHDQAGRRNEQRKYARLYSGRDFVGFGPGQFSKSELLVKDTGKLTLNVIAACVNTAASKMGAKKPRVLFQADNADWELEEASRLATLFVDGLFDIAHVYPTGLQCFVDSCVFGLGAMKLYRDGEDVLAERVLADELLIDEDDGRYGKPNQVFHRKYVHREILLEQWGHDADARFAIENAGANNALIRSVSEQVMVVEAHRLPSKKDGKDGKHCIVIDGYTLFVEPWTKNYHPYVFMKWLEALLGVTGIGLAEELIGIQIEINKLLRQIQRAIELAIPRIILHSGSRIAPSTLTDEIWSVLRTTGVAPSFSTPAALSPEVYQHLERLFSKAFAITGISEMSASARKEPGVTAAVAIQAVADIGTERFLAVGERYENFYVESARIMLDLARDIAEENPKFSIKIQDGKSRRDLNWLKDINLEENEYTLRRYPTGLLPSLPAGKLDTISTLIDKGIIADRSSALRLLDYPDLEGFISTQTAGIENVHMIVSRILNKGIATPPKPWMDLKYAHEYGQRQLLLGENRGRPQERLDALQAWIDQVSDMLEAQTPPAPPGPPAGAPPPAAPPEGMPPV